MTLLLVAAGVLGLVVGSFANVVIHRVPRGESLLRPGSHCVRCLAPVRPWHNVPVLGWLLLRGRCASCKERISARYPLVEAGTSAVFVAVALLVLAG
jgi:leader peptidase (prepilin peptidase)/N-methyltransferase